MGTPISAQNVVTNRKVKVYPCYAVKLERDQLRRWRLALAEGRLTPDMLSPQERERLQVWIFDHPLEKPKGRIAS